ncbi:MAG: flagellar biosynthesis protein FlhF [Lachnospiraceae bacterium]|nr:flagellar biosynthesis protein FlhF [Lachnospiraceae bacterium]
MVIKKYLADTQQAAILLAKEDLGNNAVVMNIKEIRPKGIFRIFMKCKVEVTAAVDDNISSGTANDSNSTVNLVADEKVSLTPNPKTLDALEQAMRNGELDRKKDKNEEKNNSGKKDIVSKDNASKDDNVINNNDSKDNRSKIKETEQPSKNDELVDFEKRIAHIQDSIKDLIDERIKNDTQKKVDEGSSDEHFSDDSDATDDSRRVDSYKKLIYEQLIDSEVTPTHAKELIEEIKDLITPDITIDRVLAIVYQKIILNLGQPMLINTKSDGKMHCSFFIGPTGVGKTTTIAKIVSDLKLNHNCKVALITADTYRIAAVEQLTTYASILDIPLSVVYSPEELKEALTKFKDFDHVLIDTAGRSHLNNDQQNDLKKLLDSVSNKDVYLTLSITTKYKDLIEVAEAYKKITEYRMIFTKLDETNGIGNIYNLRRITKSPLSYITYGQNVPDDFSKIDTQDIAKIMLGGKAYGSGRKS